MFVNLRRDGVSNARVAFRVVCTLLYVVYDLGAYI